MKIKLLGTLALSSALLLTACGQDEKKEESKPKEEHKKESNQEKVNKKIEKEATEVDFVKHNGGEYKHEQPLKITDGKVKSVGENNLGMQTALINKENSLYNVVNYSNIDIKKGETYTFYGTNDLKNDEGHPTIDITSVK